MASHPTHSSALVLFHDKGNLPPSNLPVSGPSHSPGRLHHCSPTRDRMHYHGHQCLKPQGILPYFCLLTVLTAYSAHPYQTYLGNEHHTTVIWWRKH